MLNPCGQEYWSRLWIIQEVVLAKNILIVCGGRPLSVWRLGWSQFSQALHSLDLLQSRQIEAVPWICTSLAARLERQRRAPLGTVLSSDLLYDLFIVHKDAGCTDIRDKVFGLHSLTKTCCKTGTPVDYSISPHMLYGQLLFHHFTQHQTPNSRMSIVHDSQIAHHILQDSSGSERLSSPISTASSTFLEALGNI